MVYICDARCVTSEHMSLCLSPTIIMPSRVTELVSPDLMLEDVPVRVKKAKAIPQTSDEFLANSLSSAPDSLEADEEEDQEEEAHNSEGDEESDDVVDEVDEEGFDSEIDNNEDSDDIDEQSDETGTEGEIRPARRTADEMLTDNLLVC